MNWFMIVNFSILIIGGTYGLLIVYRVIKPKPGTEERMEIWHKKFDGMMKICCTLMIIIGFILVMMEVVGFGD